MIKLISGSEDAIKREILQKREVYKSRMRELKAQQKKIEVEIKKQRAARNASSDMCNTPDEVKLYVSLGNIRSEIKEIKQRLELLNKSVVQFLPIEIQDNTDQGTYNYLFNYKLIQEVQRKIKGLEYEASIQDGILVIRFSNRKHLGQYRLLPRAPGHGVRGQYKLLPLSPEYAVYVDGILENVPVGEL